MSGKKRKRDFENVLIHRSAGQFMLFVRTSFCEKKKKRIFLQVVRLFERENEEYFFQKKIK